MNTKEQKAMEVGNNKKLLKKRLLEAKSCLPDELIKYFKNAIFDFENKRLVGDAYILQWQVRICPHEPESYTNQQTSIGVVILVSYPAIKSDAR